MARTKSIGIRDCLTTLLSAKRLRRLAQETGFVERERKIKAPAFLWTLVFGFSFGSERTIAGLRRAYETSTRISLVPSAFYDRFDKSLVRYMKAVVEDLLERTGETDRALAGQLASFKEVLATDSSVIRLHDLLESRYPATRTNHSKAAIKLHAVMNVHGHGAKSVKITGERTNDGKAFHAGPWLKDRLILFDLGYYRYQLFDCIRRNGGFFLSRLKVNANPTIVAVHRRWRGASVHLVGEKLQDVLARLRREEIDVEIEVDFKRRTYAGKRSSARERFRLVGIRNDDTGEYHLYVTNLPPGRISAQAVAATYRARWTVELLFKSLKSDFALEDMPSANENVVLSLVYAAIVTWIASRELRLAARDRLGHQARRVTEGRWTRLMRTWASFLLVLVTAPPRHGSEVARRVEFALLVEAVDPHLNRQSLLEEVERGTPFGRS
jgi:IS4 transposase